MTGNRPMTALRELPVDWPLLEYAFEQNAHGLRHYVHLGTGAVVKLIDGVADPSVYARAQPELGYTEIDPVSSRQQFRWMEDFVATLDDPDAAQALSQTLRGAGSFRRFKTAVRAYPAEAESWLRFRSSRMRAVIQEWFRARQVEPVPCVDTPPVCRTLVIATLESAAESARRRLLGSSAALATRDLETLVSLAEFFELRAKRERDAP